MRRYRTEIAVCLALAVLPLGALGHGCWNGFVNYDDGDYVSRNAHVKTGLSAANFTWAITATQAANWHPLTWLSLQLDASLFGADADSAWGFHLSNLLLHSATGVFLFLALRRMTGAVWRSAAVAALFAVHPAHVESVAWVAERKDVLSGLLWMLTLLAYAWYAERPGWGRYLLVLATFALGLMAKPMVVTLPCVLLLLDYWPLGRMRRSARPSLDGASVTPQAAPSTLLLEKLPLFALTAAACLATMYAQKKGGAVNSLEQVPFGERLTNSVVAYAGYVGELVWPSPLAVFYPHPRGRILMEQAARAGAILTVITGLVLWARRQRYLLVGWLWFLGTLVPVIGLIQVGSQAMADRYTYIPYVGLFIALVWGAADLLARVRATTPAVVPLVVLLLGVWAPLCFWWRAPDRLQQILLGYNWQEIMADGLIFYPVAALSIVAVLGWCAGRVAGLWHARLSPLVSVFALLLGVCVALTARQTCIWRNSIWLWEYAVGVTRENPTGHNNLGDAYWNSRHPFRVERARENFLAAVHLNPEHSRAHNNLGLVFLELGQLDEAAAHLKEAQRLDPTLFVARLNLGIVQVRQGEFRAAAETQREALRVDPASGVAHYGLGLALAGLGLWQEAADEFQRATELEPKEKAWHADLAWALGRLGRRDDAASEYAVVTSSDEKWLDETRQCAWTLATSPNPRRRNAFDAVRRAEQACEARGSWDAVFLDTLAAAYAEAGCLDRAAQVERQTLELADCGEAAQAMWQRLMGYLAWQPYRESM